ncbi:transposase [Microbacterium tenebrionis]|uniref:transposase n=1 Tax=Microbacterium tenebrionis TaxID=2830665 RepID=UPI00158E2AE4|nr:transposase [Microbacterium ihumii]
MGRPIKYSRELRERAFRMVAEVRSDYPSEYAAMTAVAQIVGIGSPETIRTWIRREQVDAGDRPGVRTDATVEIKRLKRDGAHRNSPELLIGIPQVAWSG